MNRIPLVALLGLSCASALGVRTAEAGEIHDAVRAGDVARVEAILASDPGQVSALDETLSAPLVDAVNADKPDVARLLLARGADVNAGDRESTTPLALAAAAGSQELVALLLDAGADPLAADDYGNTALHYAAYGGNLEVARLVLDHGAEVSRFNTMGQSPLHFATADAKIQLLDLLVERGADVNHRDAWGRPPLCIARARGQANAARRLEEKGAVCDYEIGPAAVEAIGRGFRVITPPATNRTNCGVETGPDGALLVDTGSADAAPRILEALGEMDAGRVRYIITTHLHGDHFAAHRLVDSTATVIDFTTLDERTADGVLTLSPEGLTGRTGKVLPPYYSMRFNGEEIRLIPVPGTHSDSDLLVWLTGSDVVCTGSLVVSEAWPAAPGGTLGRYFEILDAMLDVFPESTQFMPGHGRAIDMGGLRAYRRAAWDSAQAIRAELAKGKSVDSILAEKILAPWSAYGRCAFMPYQTDRLWISAVKHTYMDSSRKAD